ncbi:hypothetical protein Pint_30357 [Pistacia integerrima]|uniref:Uncharacterized protein n=1 Tax=Pistacia integerrima TaxID=434235 RepID=A0ACC0WZK2_9ROSI|nr:hypothetical protein Pint_30357 [Pistacia integerrima]
MRQGETAMYFFSPRERKYLHGNRPKRKAGEGYWKACATSSPIKINNIKVASKRVLVYYNGDNKNSTKTNWIMYEYVMEQHSIPAAIYEKGCKLKDKNEETSSKVSSELQIQTNADNSTCSTASLQKKIYEINSTHHHTYDQHVGCHNFAPQLVQGTLQDQFCFNHSAPPTESIHQCNMKICPRLMLPMIEHNFGSTSDSIPMQTTGHNFNAFSTNFAPGTQNVHRCSPSSIIQPTGGSQYIPSTRSPQPFMEIDDYGCTDILPMPLMQKEFNTSNYVGSSSWAPAMQGTNGGDATDSGESTNLVQIHVAGSGSSAPLVQRTDDQCIVATSEPILDNSASVFPPFDEWHPPDLPCFEEKKPDSHKWLA